MGCCDAWWFWKLCWFEGVREFVVGVEDSARSLGSGDVTVLCIECDKDNFHMIFKAKSTLNIPKYLNAIKTITSRKLKENSRK